MYQDREQYLRDHITEIAEDCFPDDTGIEWRIRGFDHKKSLSYVEIEPVPNAVGYDRFRFAVSFANPESPSTMAVHALEDGRYFLLSSMGGYVDPAPKMAALPAAKIGTMSPPESAATSSVTRTGIWFEGIFATLSTLVVALVLLTTWISPALIDNGRWLALAPGILAIEFIMIHSGVFMAVLPLINLKGRWWLYAALMIFYSVFVWAITTQFDNWYFLVTYSAVMLSRWLGAIKGDNTFIESMARSCAAMIFLLLVFFVMYAIPLPQFGITDEVFHQNSSWTQNGSIEQSVYWLAAAVTYFLLLTAFEWLSMIYKLRIAKNSPVTLPKGPIPQTARTG